jgi:acyl-CoA thioester hydrolase
MYLKDFDIRWSDIDANRHLANTAYINFMSHTRMSYLTESGFGQKEMAELNLGPVVFYEHMYYFKEVFSGKPVQVSLQLKGLAEDGKFFEFLHNFYDDQGNNFARCIMMAAWIDLKTRKLITPPDALLNNFLKLDKTSDFRTITKEDTRRTGKKPQHLSQ